MRLGARTGTGRPACGTLRSSCASQLGLQCCTITLYLSGDLFFFYVYSSLTCRPNVQVVPLVVLLEDNLKELVVAVDLAHDHVGLKGDNPEAEVMQLLQQG
jgi:hypothetical protein